MTHYSNINIIVSASNPLLLLVIWWHDSIFLYAKSTGQLHDLCMTSHPQLKGVWLTIANTVRVMHSATISPGMEAAAYFECTRITPAMWVVH